ncbi:MAG: ABC transporter permease [Pedobacter sp.]|nr:MAG: ABC transporter permease [Pedobacter sp.]
MIKNYFKIAIAVLKRRKFFTFISLFGISFTLTILLVATALFENVMSPSYPDYNRENSLYIDRVTIENSKAGWINSSSASFNFIKSYVTTLKTPYKIAFFTFGRTTNAYVNNKKIGVEYKFTNDTYWEVTKYDFVEGKPYGEKQVENADYVAVITERTKNEYFGNVPSVVGKYIEIDNVNYRVTGVVKDVPRTNRNFDADMYIPYTASKTDYRDQGLMGGYGAVLVAKSKADFPLIRKEYLNVLKKVPLEDGFDRLYAHADTTWEHFSRQIFGNNETVGFGRMAGVVGLLLLLFLSLPTINLVNINITRIMERSSEIGVRKAFGASSKTLVYQFLIENVILTLIGGVLGVILSQITLYLFNQSAFIPDLHLTLNFTVLTVGLFLCLIFGLLSGVYPAWRMSRLNVVAALKAN